MEQPDALPHILGLEARQDREGRRCVIIMMPNCRNLCNNLIGDKT